MKETLIASLCRLDGTYRLMIQYASGTRQRSGISRGVLGQFVRSDNQAIAGNAPLVMSEEEHHVM